MLKRDWIALFSLASIVGVSLIGCSRATQPETIHILLFASGECTLTAPILLKPGRAGKEWAEILAEFVENLHGVNAVYAVGSNAAEVDCAQTTLVPTLQHVHIGARPFTDANSFLAHINTTLPPSSIVVVDTRSFEKVIDVLGVEKGPLAPLKIFPGGIFGPYRSWDILWLPKAGHAKQGAVPLQISDRRLKEMDLYKPQEEARINILNQDELRDWSSRLSVTPEELRAVVKKVGPKESDVETEIEKHYRNR